MIQQSRSSLRKQVHCVLVMNCLSTEIREVNTIAEISKKEFEDK